MHLTIIFRTYRYLWKNSVRLIYRVHTDIIFTLYIVNLWNHVWIIICTVWMHQDWVLGLLSILVLFVCHFFLDRGGPSIFFCKSPDANHCRLHRPNHLCHSCWTLPPKQPYNYVTIRLVCILIVSYENNRGAEFGLRSIVCQPLI